MKHIEISKQSEQLKQFKKKKKKATQEKIFHQKSLATLIVHTVISLRNTNKIRR